MYNERKRGNDVEEPIITIDHLTVKYAEQQHPALDDISLTVPAHSWTAIIGHNGSGKSTMIKALTGLVTADAGTMTVAGMPVDEAHIWDIRRKMGVVFQNPENQFVGSTVADDVAFGLENAQIPRDKMIPRVQNALAQVGMTDFATREPAHLSGGQKQRVAIAGIVALAPDIIALDEATSMLDPEGRVAVLQTIRNLKAQQDLTILAVTHDLEEAAAADNVIVIDNGHLVASGTPPEIFARGEKLIDMGLAVPFTEQLKTDLSNAGVPLPAHYLTEEEMAEQIWKLYSTM
ncbi:cobalt transporter ATP-binding subunit [Schleiferilactobacillus perolens DSM 12744]|jgi:energy-coupling factor transport system ATP-binding protein|uniref:Cobalt transporter ATP-binding subunit n=1 Tax=Schleiferilactobacillus perolens DSM 12744 TaxID=1423792 RepID=A0A0R1NA52_9LACO|nr:cobalt transporter ATP-binding subunit [Schleiferilactobacillus perolens DSM 12744]